MARKDKQRRQKIGPHLEGTAGAVEWLWERHEYRDALKQAKLCFRSAETPENRELVEQAYMRRFEELCAHNMRDVASELARQWLDFGVRCEALIPKLLRRMQVMEMFAEAQRLREQYPEFSEIAAGASTENATLEEELVDAAVASGGAAPGTSPQTRENATRVWRALELLRDGQEGEALEQIQPFGRNSPWADWKLFVRGLAAHYRGDDAAATANWDRLDARRRPARIVRQLRAALNAPMGDADAVASVEQAAWGGAVSHLLRRLAACLEKTKASLASWKPVWPILDSLSQALGRCAPGLLERVSVIVYSRVDDLLLHEGFRDFSSFLVLLGRHTRPLTWDPSGHRLRALLYRRNAHFREAFQELIEYANSLRGAEGLRDDDRRRLTASTWLEIAEFAGHEGEKLERLDDLLARIPTSDSDPPSCRATPDQSPADLLSTIIQRAFARCFAAIPDHADALASCYWFHKTRWNEAGQRAVLDDWLSKYPHAPTPLRYQVGWLIRGEAPSQLVDVARKLVRALPLDEDALSIWDWAVGERTKAHVAAGEHEQALALVEEWGASVSLEKSRTLLTARRCVLLWCADRVKEAEQRIKEGLSRLSHPLPFLFALRFEGARHGLGGEFDASLAKPFKAAFSKRKSTKVAVEMASVLYVPIAFGFQESIREDLAGAFLDYVVKCGRLKFSEDELLRVCDVVHHLGDPCDFVYGRVSRVCQRLRQHGGFLFLDSLICADDAFHVSDLYEAIHGLRNAKRLLEQQPCFPITVERVEQAIETVNARISLMKQAAAEGLPPELRQMLIDKLLAMTRKVDA